MGPAAGRTIGFAPATVRSVPVIARLGRRAGMPETCDFGGPLYYSDVARRHSAAGL